MTLDFNGSSYELIDYQEMLTYVHKKRRCFNEGTSPQSCSEGKNASKVTIHLQINLSITFSVNQLVVRSIKC